MNRYFVLLVLFLVLAACGAEPAPTPDVVATQIAVEEAAHATMTAKAPPATDTPEPKDTPEPTDTSTPMDTPIPTDTPRPTRTPRPTDTPEPMATPTETPSEERLYLLEIADGGETIGKSLMNLVDLLSDPQLGDADWTQDVAFEIYAVQSVHEEAKELSVPAGLETIHAAFIDATGDCNKSMNRLVKGIDDLNADAIERSNQLSTSCIEKLGLVPPVVELYLSEGVVPTPKPTATPKATSKPKATKTPKPPPTLAKIGEQVQAGNWLFTVTDVQYHKALYLYDSAKVAMGVHAVLFMDIQNLASGTTHFGELWWRLRGAAGNEYDEKNTSRAAWQLGGKDTPWDDLNPGQTAQIVISFDVAEGAKGLKLYSGKLEKAFVLIGDAQPPQDQ